MKKQECAVAYCFGEVKPSARYCNSHVPFPWVYGQAQFYPLWQRYLLFFCTWPFVLVLRGLWQLFPYWPLCALFWLLCFMDEPLRWRDLGGRRRLFYGIALLGGLSNAVVTLANGGRMPVEGRESASSIWIPLTETSRLPFLADIYAGWSIGDFFIIGGLLLLLLNWACERLGILGVESIAVGKRLPGIGI